LIVEVVWFRSRRKVGATMPPKGARISEATVLSFFHIVM
jgi:hypothetical protein